MRYRNLTLAMLATMSTTIAVSARDIPRSGQKDARMRTVDYDPAQVVRLSTVAATALVVTFGAGEKVSAVAVTDSKNLSAMPRENFLFLKSRDVLPAQPVIVLTKGPRGVRRYVFEVEAISAARQTAEQRAIYYSVEFHYPGRPSQARLSTPAAPPTPAARAAWLHRVKMQRARAAQLAALRARTPIAPKGAQAGARKSPVAASAVVVAYRPASPPVPASNFRYVAQGDRELSPARVYDNGTSTHFYFPPNTRMPAIFRITPDGREAAANVTVKDNWVIVGGVGKNWRLRDGKSKLTVWNRGDGSSEAKPASAPTKSGAPHAAKDEK